MSVTHLHGFRSVQDLLDDIGVDRFEGSAGILIIVNAVFDMGSKDAFDEHEKFEVGLGFHGRQQVGAFWIQQLIEQSIRGGDPPHGSRLCTGQITVFQPSTMVTLKLP